MTDKRRGNLARLAQADPQSLPGFVRESQAAQHYLALLGALDWANFPERSSLRLWPGPKPLPRAIFAAIFLMKIDKGFTTMPKVRRYLLEQPALVWLLGFPLTPSDAYSWGFDVDASLPTHRHMSRVLRELDRAQVSFLWTSAVQRLADALPAELEFGQEISLDTKHILAWVRENNPKAQMADRFDKTRQPKGDPDCKLGCEKRENKLVRHQAGDTTAAVAAVATPTTEAIPARHASVGVFYWGYASGIVATKIDEWGEFVLAEFTQTFDKGDQSYFYPLMAQTATNLGFKPHSGALDAAFDAFYVYEYFHEAGGMAAVPWSNRGEKKAFSADGLPLCTAGFAMPLRNTFWNKSRALVPHECARYACPLLFQEATGERYPVDHANWPKGGCLTTLPTSSGNRVRHELDRNSAVYKELYKQRTATERINSQALDLGIEHPKLRNQRSISNHNTLLYVLVDLRALQRVQAKKATLAAQSSA
ncbi:MAG: hypothetical protein KDE47_17895 [Caldilineaceae bacterium]|nr:hypothetical protein [Caldilineaceae bacterium]